MTLIYAKDFPTLLEEDLYYRMTNDSSEPLSPYYFVIQDSYTKGFYHTNWRVQFNADISMARRISESQINYHLNIIRAILEEENIEVPSLTVLRCRNMVVVYEEIEQ